MAVASVPLFARRVVVVCPESYAEELLQVVVVLFDPPLDLLYFVGFLKPDCWHR